MSRSKLNQTLDKLYAAESIDIPFGEPINKIVVNHKTLIAFPLSDEEIEFAEAGAVHNPIQCETCKGIDQ